MREETLKNLVHVISKLDERNRQEKLVRCIVSLQTDAEASIRTNATIFLGRIAASLSEAVRAKVLCNCYCKAMKDNFLHCRYAYNINIFDFEPHYFDFDSLVLRD